MGQGTALSSEAMSHCLVLKMISMGYFHKNETYLKRRGGCFTTILKEKRRKGEAPKYVAQGTTVETVATPCGQELVQGGGLRGTAGGQRQKLTAYPCQWVNPSTSPEPPGPFCSFLERSSSGQPRRGQWRPGPLPPPRVTRAHSLLCLDVVSCAAPGGGGYMFACVVFHMSTRAHA